MRDDQSFDILPALKREAFSLKFRNTADEEVTNEQLVTPTSRTITDGIRLEINEPPSHCPTRIRAMSHRIV